MPDGRRLSVDGKLGQIRGPLKSVRIGGAVECDDEDEGGQNNEDDHPELPLPDWRRVAKNAVILVQASAAAAGSWARLSGLQNEWRAPG